jgi:hypothetical protein
MAVPDTAFKTELTVAGARRIAEMEAEQTVAIPASNWSRELVKAIATDIGADTVAYIEVMYPKAIAATSSTFKTSVCNHIYNQIMAAIEVTDEGKVVVRLRDRKKFRRWWVGVYRKIRRES